MPLGRLGKVEINCRPKSGYYACNISARLTGKAARQGCQARLPGKAARQGCRARLPGKAAGQGCQARLPGKAARQGCNMVQYAKSLVKMDNNAVF
jgi:hypothetical protein